MVMNAVVEKIGEADGKERFLLVDQKSGKPLTQKPVSEATMRRYLASVGESEKLIDECFRKARGRYDKSHDQDDDLDDILEEIGLDE